MPRDIIAQWISRKLAFGSGSSTALRFKGDYELLEIPKISLPKLYCDFAHHHRRTIPAEVV